MRSPLTSLPVLARARHGAPLPDVGRACARSRSRASARRGGGGRPATAAPFLPSDIVGQEFWYRGDDTVDVGGVVQTWTDKSGNGRHATQGTAAARPTPVTRAGQRALSFDGGDQLVATFAGALTQPTTIYLVWEVTAIMGVQVLLDGNDGTNRNFIYATATGPAVRAGAPTELAGGAPSAGQIYATCFVVNGASSALYGRSNFVTAGATGNAGTAVLDGLTLGASNASTLRLTGYEWEAIGYSGAHDAATRKQIGDYLTSHYPSLTVTT